MVRPNADAITAAQAQARANAKDALARTSQAIQAVQKMQAAARAAAASGANNLGADPNHPGLRLPNIPNGLTPGGLQVAPGVPVNLTAPQPGEDPRLWQGANLPRQSNSKGGVDVIIDQTASQAVLTWKTFNVGKDTTVIFNQSGGKQTNGSNNWIAFNKILDPSGVPSQILGSIQADASVYLINQNGIIFGGSSQINLRSLVASSLAINDNLISRGLLNNPDSQFLFSSIALPAGSNGTPAFTPAVPFTPNGQPGDVVVQPGATLSTLASADHTGGRIALVGPNVRNSGTISTPDGQAILAAGLQVGFAAHPSDDATLRGLDTYVGAVANGGFSAGTATNDGLIDAPRADVMMTGQTVNQLGAIQSTTSATLNGRVDLVADYDAVGNLSTNINNNKITGGARNLSPFVFLPKSSGIVNIGMGSVTQILPEYSSSETSPGMTVPLSSTIVIQGKAVHFSSNSMMLAPSANVNVSAGVWRFDNTNSSNPLDNFVYTGGQIYLDRNALINVAGSTDISAPMSENILSVQLRGSELRNSPLQRDGTLRAISLTIDIRQQGTFNGLAWVGTPLGDATGFVNVIQRDVGELTINGGTVSMKAGDSIVMQSGSTVDVSGGWVNYQGAMVQTTRVLAGSQLLDISQATPDRVYDGIYTGQYIDASHAKYGITETYTSPLALTGAHFEPTYSYGGNGGTVTLTAPSMALDGNLVGQTTAGPRQRTLTPTLSTLAINFQMQDLSVFPTNAVFSPTPPQVTFSSDKNLAPAAAFALDATGAPIALRADRKASVVLSPDLFSSGGFGNLALDNTDGSVVVPEGADLEAPAGGSLTIKAANITVGGKVAAPGGVLSFTVTGLSQAKVNSLPALNPTSSPALDQSRGNFILTGDGLLTTAGLVVDDRPTADSPAELPYKTAGGTITIQAVNVNLAEGGAIDVSGGVAVGGTGKKTYGNAGTISILSGQDKNIPSSLGGQLVLGATLRGFSGAAGGTLNLQAPLVQIGGAPTLPRELFLTPDFFSEGGFTAFNITALGAAGSIPGTYLPALTIAPGTQITPVAQSFVAELGREITLAPLVAPLGVRRPVSLSFAATGIVDQFNSNSLLTRGDLVMGAGASIQTDPLGSVSLSGNTVTVLGSIVAPGGAITIAGKNNSAILNANPNFAVPNVDLGPQSFLSTVGTTVLVPDPRGFRVGAVLPGGTIKVSGNIVAEAGAVLDVSGTGGVLDLPPTYSTLDPLPVRPLNGSFLGYAVVPTRIDSNGGTIILAGDQEMFVDATLRGFAGGPSAIGGTLSVSSGHFVAPGNQALPTDIDLVVTQEGATIPRSFYGAGQTAIGHSVLDATGAMLPGRGYFAANTFLNGGFDSLSLGGVVDFAGPVTITARRSLTVATSTASSNGGVIFADSAVQLNAPYVALGAPFAGPLDPTVAYHPFPFTFLPTFGSGSFSVRGSLIDVGNLSLQNIGQTTLVADGGDIRGDGTFDAAGSVVLLAGQIYPASAVAFTISVSDKNIVVKSSASGNATVTLASAKLPPGFGVGSPLLGSTVQSINGATVTLTAGANATISANTPVTFAPGSGSVTIVGSGDRQLPLSAGGTLSIYGANITQGGVLRAPLGAINLGWNGDGTAPTDSITGQSVAVSQQVTLSGGSVTSISAVDPKTGQALIIPYGLNLNGTSWIDPTGIDITATGAPSKGVNIGGLKVNDMSGSLIDLRGGGDLYAYRFVSGNLGSQDILASTTTFAVIPGYAANYAPYAPNATNSSTGNLGGDPGYTNTTLSVGDQIYLGGSSALAAGTYTLLPARYALLPGAVLVTVKSGAPLGTVAMPDESSLVSGYIVNSLDTQRSGARVAARFEVASADVFRQRAEYDDFFANSYLRDSEAALGVAVARRPVDAGRLVIQGTLGLTLDGVVKAQGAVGARNGQVEISTTADILIGGPGSTGAAGVVVLDADKLSSYGAESLLIGGIRQTVGADQSLVSVKTGNITVDNAGAPLLAQDIILVANKAVTLAPNAEVGQVGPQLTDLDTLLIGNAATPGSGNGALLRVSADFGADVIRSGVTNVAGPALTVGAGATISGAGVILDSTSATNLSPQANLRGTVVSLNSGQISFELDNPGALQPTTGLVLTGAALEALQSSAAQIGFSSYSSIDVYGTGSVSSGSTLALHAAEFRVFNNGGGTASFDAPEIILDNRSNGTAVGSVVAPSGSLDFNATTIILGANTVKVDQAATVNLNASGGVLAQGAGSFLAQGALNVNAPVITGAKAANYTIQATGGALVMQAPAGSTGGSVTGGLGATLNFVGASVTANTSLLLPSGIANLHATTGDLNVSGLIEVGGTAQQFYTETQYTDAGQISLSADNGEVILNAGSILNVAAAPGGGNAGSIAISAPHGIFTAGGTITGHAGAGGKGGTFSVDAGSIPGGSVTGLDTALNAGGFTESRTYRVRTGNITVDGLATSHTYNISADAGDITVTGTGLIDASGVTGGTINLVARGSVTLQSGAVLTVAAQNFDDAGKGGAISLEAGSDVNGTVGATTAILDLQTGSTINLTVAANTANSASFGQFTGTLHLRAPQNAAGTDLQINAINATIVDGIGAVAGTSSITIEGYKIFTATGGTNLDAAVLNAIKANGNNFVGAAGTASATYNAMVARLFGADPQGLYAKSVILPGAEVVNLNGDLILGNATATATAGDWNMATLRFGPKNAAGVLTLRAKGNLVFLNSLSDGFATGAYNAALLAPNTALNANAQSWSYRLAAGADFGGVDFHDVLAGAGSLKLGRDDGANISNSNGANNAPGNTATTGPSGAAGTNGAQNRYQVIRTGSGDITISSGGDVQLLNEFAGIYTAGTRVADPTMGGTFDVPVLSLVGTTQGSLGSVQESPIYPAQYSMAGGNVTINALGSIVHQTLSNGVLVDDSSREMPYNWLYRRGFVDPVTGKFGAITRAGGTADVGSTTWWVDFSNFFEGVGALGGGNVTLIAGVDVRNVDGLIPTNARMPGKDVSNNPIAPNAASLVELGGGDLIVRAGHDISGGVYYVERGTGNLHAGNEITTNSTRTPSLGTPLGQDPGDPHSWLPTTLFMGKSSFQVSAAGNVLLGPALNPFLLPQGFSNTYWDKTYFSTLSPDASVTVTSLGGNVTFREAVALPGSNSVPIMQAWLQNISLLTPDSLSFYQPWLRLDEDSVDPFNASASSIQPGTFKATAFSGDINIVGNLTLSPSPTGTVDFEAAHSINGLQPAGVNIFPLQSWISGQINLSDALPSSIPGIASPFAYRTTLPVGNNTVANRTTGTNGFLGFIDALFAETGSTTGAADSLTVKQALHDSSILHAGDPVPVRLFANGGDISGLTLFSGKSAQIIAGNDITDISFYIQNVNPSDVSVVSAGRDIIAFDANSVLRSQANSPGNLADTALAGDIQISGPGTLEILAGRNLDLGTGAQRDDGTGSGITSIGNARNPSLPNDGASVIVGAGVGQAAVGLANTDIDFDAFLKTYLGSGSATPSGPNYLAELQDLLGPSVQLSASTLDNLTQEQKAALGLQLFYLVLRDAGRNHNDPAQPTFGTYDDGFAAIAKLFGQSSGLGDINTRSRDIRTRSGGYIDIFAPSGGLKLATATIGNPQIPPGIVTEAGGAVSVFTKDNVDIGISRIFTLRGGDIIIWSSAGNIAAGTSAKTVQSAPPTRVVIDPQSANVATDLAGLATGGGIGVLATVEGVKPGNVDLIAPVGVVDAGDAGIRATGNLNIAATAVLNASNIQVAGNSSGVPGPAAVSAPNIGGLTSANNAAAAANTGAEQVAKQNQADQPVQEEPSVITVEVLGYGGGEGTSSDDGQ